MKSMLKALGFKTITAYEFRVAARDGNFHSCRLVPAIRDRIKQILLKFDYLHKNYVNALEIRLKDKIENIPDAFICPITQQIIQDPVYFPEVGSPKDAAANHAFERVALVKWIEDPDPEIKSIHPLTRKVVSIHDIKSHTVLKEEIDNFISEVENNHSKKANNAPEEKTLADPSPLT